MVDVEIFYYFLMDCFVLGCFGCFGIGEGWWFGFVV